MAQGPKRIRRSWIPERKPFEQRAVDNSRFYNSRTWRNLRKRFLDANPLCAECERNGEVRQATVADHIIPISRGGAELDDKNLQPLCKRCHDSKSARERSGRGGMG
ncbi:HNH endonuclease [Flavobacterium sp. Leaf359]|uniref:HNH endonuclease n=1 Tax=Flavobacterium sp. Leaf359 TaxID=1736351 RepID=UPI0009E6CEA7|nr:HNH endonuclease signature motif containing protein [Flavobacterium sp. Leaf359]